jgi:hypothetical protein
MRRVLKIIAYFAAGVVVLFLVVWQLDFGRNEKPVWGATFSQYYAQELLKIDWRETYGVILNDLSFKKLRLVAYWDYLEPEKNTMKFDDLDWQIEEAEKGGKEIVLALGYRVPRWPECHAPEWAKKLDRSDFDESLLSYIGKVIGRYKGHVSIKGWQVENEPFVSAFGECPPLDREMLRKEIGLVKSLDSDRPVIVTDSGELSLWTQAARYGDVLGTTLYRVVWNPTVGKFRHFIPPAFYAWRAQIAERFFGAKNVIISELQAEPWAVNNASISNIAFDRQTENLTLEEFKDIVNFAKKTGLKEMYLWGPEWWYYRELNGDPSWMEFGKTL